MTRCQRRHSQWRWQSSSQTSWQSQTSSMFLPPSCPKSNEFQTRLKLTYDSYVSLRPASRKREHQTLQKPLTATPTQSPLQKTGRLQSVVTVAQNKVTPVQPQRDRSAHRDRSEDGVIARRCPNGTFMSAPYHLITAPPEQAEEFLLYCTDRFNRDDFRRRVDGFQ